MKFKETKNLNSTFNLKIILILNGKTKYSEPNTFPSL